MSEKDYDMPLFDIDKMQEMWTCASMSQEGMKAWTKESILAWPIIRVKLHRLTAQRDAALAILARNGIIIDEKEGKLE